MELAWWSPEAMDVRGRAKTLNASVAAASFAASRWPVKAGTERCGWIRGGLSEQLRTRLRAPDERPALVQLQPAVLNREIEPGLVPPTEAAALLFRRFVPHQLSVTVGLAGNVPPIADQEVKHGRFGLAPRQ